MHVRGVDFVAVGVTDMLAAQAFYRDTLGLAVIFESEGWSEYETGNMALAVVDISDENDELAGAGWKNALVALAVEDAAKTFAELQAKGVKTIGETSEYTPCYMAMFEDPFGNRLMLHQRKDGTVG